MSLKTFLLGLALGGIAVNLYGKARPARGGDAEEPIGPDPSLAANRIGSGLGGEPVMGARTDDLPSPGDTAPAAEPTPEVTVAERF